MPRWLRGRRGRAGRQRGLGQKAAGRLCVDGGSQLAGSASSPLATHPPRVLRAVHIHKGGGPARHGGLGACRSRVGRAGGMGAGRGRACRLRHLGLFPCPQSPSHPLRRSPSTSSGKPWWVRTCREVRGAGVSVGGDLCAGWSAAGLTIAQHERTLLKRSSLSAARSSAMRDSIQILLPSHRWAGATGQLLRSSAYCVCGGVESRGEGDGWKHSCAGEWREAQAFAHWRALCVCCCLTSVGGCLPSQRAMGKRGS